MKISLKWLNEYVDVHDFFERPQKLAHLLTTAGLEVEEIQDLAQQFKFVKTALILERDRHPDADKLTVCKVTTGEGIIHQIVCGAKNHKAQDIVVLALPGAVLPGNFAIKNSVIRGISSDGMLCSYKELGLAEESEGIAILPEKTPIGIPFSQYAELNDVTFELKVTPNRADCLSHMGLAREISCLLDRPFKAPVTKEWTSKSTEAPFSVEVLNPDMCPRYTGCIINKVKVGPSPDWLKKRLESVGLNSINNIVDITNYVMMEWGQPLHAFDLRHIHNGKIRVSKAASQEKFITLDGTELILRGDELMIQDDQRSLCVAGVIGGKNSGVQYDTQDIFLESAFFSPQFTRRSARNHGLNTDSAYRFSRGVDPNVTIEALKRAIGLILEIAGGNVGSHIFEVKNSNFSTKSININPQTVTDRLGYPVEIQKFESWLQRLGCQIQKTSTQSYEVTPPSWRFDLEMDMDLVEEYARLNGYEHIPESLPALLKAPTHHDKDYLFQSQLIELMRSMGYNQAVNFAFISSSKQSEFVGDHDLMTKTGLQAIHQTISLINPLNEQMNVMRTQLSMGLLDNLEHNFHYGVTTGRLFEIGSTFDQHNGEYIERPRWAGIAWGWPNNLWAKDHQTPVVMDLKQSIEEILHSLGFRGWQWVHPRDLGGCPHFLHPGQTVALNLNGKRIGFLGTLHPTIREEKKLRCDAALFEFELSGLGQAMQRKLTIKPISKFQAVERDLSLVMSNSIGAGTLIQDIRKTAGALLQNVAILDTYEGKNLGDGLKSVTYRLLFQDLERTLTDAQVQSSIDTILATLKKHWEIQVR